MKVIRCFAIAAGLTAPILCFAQNQPTPSREDAERNAFQTPTTGKSAAESSGAGARRESGVEPDSQAGAQNSSNNPEAKKSAEPPKGGPK